MAMSSFLRQRLVSSSSVRRAFTGASRRISVATSSPFRFIRASFYSVGASKGVGEVPHPSSSEEGGDDAPFQWPAPDVDSEKPESILSQDWLNPEAPVDGQTFDKLSYERPDVHTTFSNEDLPDLSIPDSVRYILDTMKAQDVTRYHKVRKEAEDIFIATGLSRVHLNSLADAISRAIKRKRKINVEGRADGDWILIDAGNTIVHMFSEECREEYDLDGLYSTPPMSIEELEELKTLSDEGVIDVSANEIDKLINE